MKYQIVLRKKQACLNVAKLINKVFLKHLAHKKWNAGISQMEMELRHGQA